MRMAPRLPLARQTRGARPPRPRLPGAPSSSCVRSSSSESARARHAAPAVLLGALPAPRLDAPASAFAGCLLALAVWAGLTTLWSTSPDRSWSYTNRTLVYTGFAVLGLVVGAIVPRERLAEAAALLLA